MRIAVTAAVILLKQLDNCFIKDGDSQRDTKKNYESLKTGTISKET